MVFLVPRKGTRSLVAIKEVKTCEAEDKSYEREFNYMSKLSHPKLVECMATSLFPASSRGYIVMRAADSDLERFLEHSSRPGQSEVGKLCLDGYF